MHAINKLFQYGGMLLTVTTENKSFTIVGYVAIFKAMFVTHVIL
jgi:hypothetical protein